MNILEQILGAGNGAAVRQMAGQLGLQEKEARSGMEHLLPALTGALQRNAQQPQGAEALLNALRRGNHQRYLDAPAELQRRETVDDGNRILGHLLGSKTESRRVASEASKASGLGSGTLKKMLPFVAAMAMGSMSKQANDTGLLGGGQKSSGALGSLLGGFLNTGGGQSGLGGMLGKLFGR